MDKTGFVHRRKKRYMAQLLEEFEEKVEPDLSPAVAAEFKATVRQKLHALALDACEIISLKPGEEINGAMIELRDHMHIHGRPMNRSSTT